MIWMENITHTTNKGSSEFGLANTNKLVRQYEYTTGLKTGSTGEAKFCVSATAKQYDLIRYSWLRRILRCGLGTSVFGLWVWQMYEIHR